MYCTAAYMWPLTNQVSVNVATTDHKPYPLMKHEGGLQSFCEAQRNASN